MSKLTERLQAIFRRRTTAATPRTAPANGLSVDRKLVLRLSGKRMPSAKQLKHLPRFLSPRERQALTALAIVGFLGLAGAGGKFAGAHIVSEPARGGDYTEAVVGSPRYINPILSSVTGTGNDIARLVFSGLLKTSPDGALTPDLAESYDISPDGKTYTFRLRSGVEWHDGEPFTSNDVVATVGYVKDPSWLSPLASQLKNVTVEAPDETTVVFTLSEPFSPFASLLTFGILPEHLWQSVKPENASRAELNLKPVGTGPFKFKNLTKDKKGAVRTYTLVRNEKYHGGAPLLATFTFKFYQDFTEAAEALVTKRIDGLSFLPLELRDTVERVRAVHLYRLRLPQYTAVFFNQKKNAALRSKDLRLALTLATDAETLVRDVLRGTADPIHGPIAPGFLGFHPDIARAAFDPGKAADLLDKDGWKLDADGVRTRNATDEKTKEVTKTPLELTLLAADTKESADAVEAIAHNWERLGIKVSVETASSAKIQKEQIRGREYDALLYGEIMGPDPDPYPFWHSSQSDAPGLNLAMFSNRRVDELLEKGRLSMNAEERAAFYKEFQDIVAEEMPATFLYSPTYTYAVSRNVRGIGAQIIYSPADRFANVADWYVKTRRVWK